MHHGPASATRGRYTTVTKLFIVQFCCCSSWRLSTARPNVQHGSGATNGIFNPIRWSACVLCVHGRLSAKEELQNIAEIRATRSMPRLLMVPPPLNFRAATERKKKSEMQVRILETDSDPAGADLLIHVLNILTCPLDQKLRAFKMHTKVGARSSILRFLGMQRLNLKCERRNIGIGD